MVNVVARCVDIRHPWCLNKTGTNYACTFFAAHTANFSRKILALWRISTGKWGCSRKSVIRAVSGFDAAELTDFGEQGFPLLRRSRLMPLVRFQNNHRALPAGGADADQGAAADGGVLVEDRLATDRIHRAVGRQHAMGHAAAKPEAILFVQIAAVADPVPHRRPVGDLRQRVPLRPRDVRPRDLRPGDDQFADFAEGHQWDTGGRPIFAETKIGTVPDSSTSSIDRIGPSTMRITFQRISRNRRPTHTPPPWRVRAPCPIVRWRLYCRP